jgi:hypothetical protein
MNKSRTQIFNEIDSEIRRMHGVNLKDFLKRVGKERWGIKDPRLTYCLHCVNRNFPDARFIIILRDGRAVSSSYIRSRWGIATNIYYGALVWKKELELQLKFSRAYPEKCYVVRYEDLVKDPERELEDICRFLNVSYAKNMLYYYREPSYIKKTKQSENTFKEIDESIVHKWQRELTSFQIDVFESIAGDMLRQNKYELIGNEIQISRLLKWWFMIHQGIVGEIQLQYQLKSQRLRNVVRKFFGK